MSDVTRAQAEADAIAALLVRHGYEPTDRPAPLDQKDQALLARIVAVADSIDAMSSDTPSGMTSAAARSSIRLYEPRRRLPAIPTIVVTYFACLLGSSAGFT